MLFPFDLLACFSAAYLFANSISGRKRGLVLLAQGCILCLWTASNLESLTIHFGKFKDAAGFYGRFSPRIESLAKFLNKEGRMRRQFIASSGGWVTNLGRSVNRK